MSAYKTRIPVAHRLCAGMRKRFVDANAPPATSRRPTIAPITIRIVGVIRLLSKAYLTKKTVPRKKANPPIHANSFTPRTDSRFIFEGGAGAGGAGAAGTGGAAAGAGTTGAGIGAG